MFFIFNSSAPFSELQLQNLSKILSKVFLIFPNYCLGMSLNQFYQNYEFISFCTSNTRCQDLCQILSKLFFTMSFYCLKMCLTCSLVCFLDITYQTNYFSMSSPGIGRFLVALSVQGLVFVLLLFVIELQFVKTLHRFVTTFFMRRRQVDRY